jgi:hypothetical protein
MDVAMRPEAPLLAFNIHEMMNLVEVSAMAESRIHAVTRH